MPIYGHNRTLALLHKKLPRVSLFTGPPSVGKWATAEHLRSRNKISPLDTLRIHKLTADTARAIVDFASLGPVAGSPWRFVIVETSGSTTTTQDILLKTLEESHESIRFFLIHDPDTVMRSTLHSRATPFHFNRLSTEHVSKILQERKGMAEPLADRLAALSKGTVQGAVDAATWSEDKVPVLRAVLAIRERNPHALEQLAKVWTDTHTALLEQWCQECITGDWNVFAYDEAEIKDRSFSLKILRALLADVRPKLVIRSSLMRVLRSN